MYKHSIFNLCITAAFLTLTGCAQRPGTQPVKSSPAGTEVTVNDARGLDGCNFLLVTATGDKLDPVNLDTEFQKEGIRLRITYRPAGGVGVCMSGLRVELISVNPITEK